MAGALVTAITGLSLWFGKNVRFFSLIGGGERVSSVVHIVLAFLLLAFVVVHVAQVVRAGWPTMLGMLTGRIAVSPRRTRRAIGWSAGILASIVVVFFVANLSDAANGVPSFLQWTVERRHATAGMRHVEVRGEDAAR